MDRFHRVELSYTQMFVERKFYEPNQFGDYVVVQRQYRSVASPSITLVGDNTLFSYFGPVNGQRYNITYSPSFDWFPNGLEYHTATWDSRRYWDFTHGYTFVTRTLMGVSGGRDPQVFRVGGFSTLRGYSDYDLLGTRLAIANVELRFPFIQQLGLVGPVPIGVFNLRGVAFADGGLIWNNDRSLEWKPLRTAVQPHNGFATGFGGGIRTMVAFMILKLDVAWSTDFVGVSQPRWYFSIGPEL
jgi:outer membrane protein assembly factor BamA